MATSFYNVSDILKSVGALTEQEAILPTGTDLTVRLQYINDSLGEWADTYTWQDLRTIYAFTTSGITTTQITLPTDFREPLSTLYIYTDSKDLPTEYPLIDARDRFSKYGTDKYCYLTGTFRNKTLNVPVGLASGVSCQIDYMAFPTTVIATSDYVPISSSQYIVKRVSAMVFQARGDSRFPLLQAEAQRLLSNAIEEQNVPFGKVNRIPMNTQSFTIGVDG
jgi:hypothetical protein